MFGKSGWIGGLIGQLLKERGLKFEYANARLEERSDVIAELERVGTRGSTRAFCMTACQFCCAVPLYNST